MSGELGGLCGPVGCGAAGISVSGGGFPHQAPDQGANMASFAEGGGGGSSGGGGGGGGGGDCGGGDSRGGFSHALSSSSLRPDDGQYSYQGGMPYGGGQNMHQGGQTGYGGQGGYGYQGGQHGGPQGGGYQHGQMGAPPGGAQYMIIQVPSHVNPEQVVQNLQGGGMQQQLGKRQRKTQAGVWMCPHSEEMWQLFFTWPVLSQGVFLDRKTTMKACGESLQALLAFSSGEGGGSAKYHATAITRALGNDAVKPATYRGVIFSHDEEEVKGVVEEARTKRRDELVEKKKAAAAAVAKHRQTAPPQLAAGAHSGDLDLDSEEQWGHATSLTGGEEVDSELPCGEDDGKEETSGATPASSPDGMGGSDSDDHDITDSLLNFVDGAGASYDSYYPFLPVSREEEEGHDHADQAGEGGGGFGGSSSSSMWGVAAPPSSSVGAGAGARGLNDQGLEEEEEEGEEEDRNPNEQKMADHKPHYGDALGAADDDGKEDAGEAAGGGAPEVGDGADPQVGAPAEAAADAQQGAGAAAVASAGANDLVAWLASVHTSLVPFALVFKAKGYVDVGLIEEMEGDERDDLFAALDAGLINPPGKILRPQRRKLVAALDKLLGGGGAGGGGGGVLAQAAEAEGKDQGNDKEAAAAAAPAAAEAARVAREAEEKAVERECLKLDLNTC